MKSLRPLDRPRTYVVGMLLIVGATLFAINPSLTDFDSNQFSTTSPSFIHFKSGGSVTNLFVATGITGIGSAAGSWTLNAGTGTGGFTNNAGPVYGTNANGTYYLDGDTNSFSGKVGIGGAAGDHALTVTSTNNNSLAINSTGTDPASMGYLQNVGVQGPFFDWHSAGGHWAVGNSQAGNYSLRYSAGSDAVNGTVWMNVLPSGEFDFLGPTNVFSGTIDLEQELRATNSVGTSGQALVSAGAGKAPYWKTVSGSGDVVAANNNTLSGSNSFSGTTDLEGALRLTNSTGSSGQVVSSDGAGKLYWQTLGGGSGTVTSVGASGPAGFTWSSAVTGAGTLTATTPSPVLTNSTTLNVTLAGTTNHIVGSLGIDGTQTVGTFTTTNITGPYDATVGAVIGTNGSGAAGFTANLSFGTNLNATELRSGTVADARLSANVSLLNAAQTITGAKAYTASNYFGGVVEYSTNGLSLNVDFSANGNYIYTNTSQNVTLSGFVNANLSIMNWKGFTVTNSAATAVTFTWPAGVCVYGTNSGTSLSIPGGKKCVGSIWLDAYGTNIVAVCNN